jgi:hypothetical protein
MAVVSVVAASCSNHRVKGFAVVDSSNEVATAIQVDHQCPCYQIQLNLHFPFHYHHYQILKKSQWSP